MKELLKQSDVQAYLQTLAFHLENLTILDRLQRAQILSAYNRLPDVDVAEVERFRRKLQCERPTLDLTNMAPHVVRRVDSNLKRKGV